jgi:hypothetical protein
MLLKNTNLLLFLYFLQIIFPNQALQNTENTLWAESAGYIADRFYEEQEQK